jgi:hypothetical protein
LYADMLDWCLKKSKKKKKRNLLTARFYLLWVKDKKKNTQSRIVQIQQAVQWRKWRK